MSTAYRRETPWKRSPVGRADTQGGQLLIKRLPAAASFDSDVTILQIDLDNGVQVGDVHQ